MSRRISKVRDLAISDIDKTIEIETQYAGQKIKLIGKLTSIFAGQHLIALDVDYPTGNNQYTRHTLREINTEQEVIIHE